MNANRVVEDRFWSKVDKSGDCWQWQGAKKPTGYGSFKFLGSTRQAHRVAWALTHGSLPPKDLVVMHTCDNPGCVRPDHLQLGTQAENVQDAVSKQRHQRGEKNGKAKLTPRQVRRIRNLFEREQPSYAGVARAYGVSAETVKNIVIRASWQHLN